MCRMSSYFMVALSGAFAVSAHAETRTVIWQGQTIEANIKEPTRGPGLSREELLKMAGEAVPVKPVYTPPNKAGQTGQ
jgi:hypothetical protein